MTKKLILLRHGESEWNALNLFTGWVDVRLSEKGIGEAKRGGQLLKERGLLPDIVHTSLLRRAIHTSQLALDEADRHWIPVKRSWRLNERHYGALQGKDKKETLAQYGEEQFQLWRRCRPVFPLWLLLIERAGRGNVLTAHGAPVPLPLLRPVAAAEPGPAAGAPGNLPLSSKEINDKISLFGTECWR